MMDGDLFSRLEVVCFCSVLTEYCPVKRPKELLPMMAEEEVGAERDAFETSLYKIVLIVIRERSRATLGAGKEKICQIKKSKLLTWLVQNQ